MNINNNLLRLDENRLEIKNEYGVKVLLFANQEVPIENAAVQELIDMLEIQQTAKSFYKASPESFDEEPEISRVAVTPDFHKAKGIPVGTVLATKGFIVPQAIGNDVNCGMRLHTTSLQAEQVVHSKDPLEKTFRYLFFEGGRNIPMTREQREAMLTNGLTGLYAATPKNLTEGLWQAYHRMDMESDLLKIENRGSLVAEQIFGLDDFLGIKGQYTRDSQIGSIGGGNHFVEIQYVKKVLEGTTAHAWGITEGMVTVMVHTGSVSIGHLSGNYYRDLIRKIYPGTNKYPQNGIFILPNGEKFQSESKLFWDSLSNAGNFAFANRLFLAIMAWEGLRKVCGDTDFSLLYDAPHNFLWKQKDEKGAQINIHRKGACPARDMSAMTGTPFEYFGEPVLVPGSMGASSFILAGQGNNEALNSASHGAGRTLSRGQSTKGNEEAFHQFLEQFRIVTPIDLNRQDVKQRRDIVERKLSELKQEAPFAYKGIGPVVKTLTDSGIARPVAELEPIMTIKG